MYTPEVWVEQHVYPWKMMVGRPFVGFDHFSRAKPPLPPSALFEDSDDSEGPPKAKYCLHLLMYCAFYIPTRPICRNPHTSWKESSHQPRKMSVYQPSTPPSFHLWCCRKVVVLLSYLAVTSRHITIAKVAGDRIWMMFQEVRINGW